MEKVLAVGLVIVMSLVFHLVLACVFAFGIEASFNSFGTQVFGANPMTYTQALCAYLFVYCLGVAANAKLGRDD
jgi:hypothetical protein